MKKFVVLFLLVCLSCQEDIWFFNKNPQKAILGKWEIISYGYSESDMKESVRGFFTEFLRDGTTRDFTKETEVEFQYFDFYTIDKNLLKIMSTKDGIGGNTSCFKYDFYHDKLKLTSHPLREQPLYEIFISNIIIYKKVKK